MSSPEPAWNGLVDCPVCDRPVAPARRVRARIGGAEISIGECKGCRIALQTPRVTVEGSRAYMDSRWASTDPNDAYVTDTAGKLAMARHRVRWLNSLGAPSRKILDFGAGNGAFCAACVEAGWECVGIELSRSAIEAARRSYGVDLYGGTLEERPAEAPFGAAVMWDVIEHLRDPLAVLRQIYGRLAPGGVLVVETGNYESASRLGEGDRWGLYLYDHMYYFSPASLGALLERAGFREFRLCRIPAPPAGVCAARDALPARLVRKAFRAARHPGLVAARLRYALAKARARKLWPEHWDTDVMVAVVRK